VDETLRWLPPSDTEGREVVKRVESIDTGTSADMKELDLHRLSKRATQKKWVTVHCHSYLILTVSARAQQRGRQSVGSRGSHKGHQT
jgi:hypothetical protein